jgi:N-carbamoylputrescine amidase
MITPRKVTVAATQASYGLGVEANVNKVVELVKAAHAKGAQVILPTELFEGPYFCREEKDDFFDWARPAENHPTIKRFQQLARELKVAIPVSFFEKDGPHHYNSLAMVNEEGEVLGLYRKSHIPDGPGYEEKFYFRPGNTGFKVWKTKHATVGVGICWDQWYPECARAMALMGAEVLFYPTAIGTEPESPNLDTKDLWQRAMIGHAVSNVMPVVASNRIGTEGGAGKEQTFYGHSFISDHRGEKVAELGRKDEGVITATFDLEEVRRNRASFGFFRDRRPELYTRLSTDC